VETPKARIARPDKNQTIAGEPMRTEPGLIQSPAFSRPAAIMAAVVDPQVDPNDRDACLNRIDTQVRSAGATILPGAGHGMMAGFGSAAAAFVCALRIQAGVEPLGAVRIGLAADDDATAGTHHGPVVVLAQQLRAAAPAGGIALTGTLHQHLFDMLPLPATRLPNPFLGNRAELVTIVTVSAADCEAWSLHGQEATTPSTPDPDDRISLAVIPLRSTTSGVTELAESVTDDAIRIIGGLSPWFGVTRTSSQSLRNQIDMRQVRQLCDARYVLHGSANKERSALRLNLELNDAATGRMLWSDRFDNGNGDAITLRDVCAPRIAGAVAPALAARELERTARTPFASLTAQEIALRALSVIMQPERATFAAAADWLRTALTRPPPHTAVHLAIVSWHLVALIQGLSTSWTTDAEAAIDASRHLDRSDPSSLALLAFIQAILLHDPGAAHAMLDRVIDQAPFCATAWSMKARVLLLVGEGQDAIFHAEQAAALPSLGFDRAWRNSIVAMAYYTADRYQEAIRWGRVAAMHFPGLAMTQRVLAASLVALGKLDEARQAAAQVLAIDPRFCVGAWRGQAKYAPDRRERYAQRLRLAGLPE
jgi:adenylate cyclase